MITTYKVTFEDGSQRTVGTLSEAAQLVKEHPGAVVKPRVHYTPCDQHPAYEAANCPLCGTAARIQ